MPINPSPVKRSTDPPAKEKKKPFLFRTTDPIFTFEDVLLTEQVKQEVDDAISLVQYQKTIFDDWGLKQVMKKQGNITLNLYGDSGTGKTMCAHAIANQLGKKLVVINYAEIESKYVGETAKNLVSLFEYASENDVILFFDEADALLSKRVTDMNSAADVSVNQTRNVLLKLLDEYRGIIIFTTNFISNFDQAFFRRITSHVKFDLPNQELRSKIWGHYLVPQLPLESPREEVIERLSQIEGVSGADISNCVLKTALRVATARRTHFETRDFEQVMKTILEAKRALEDDKFQVSTRKVPESYVKEKIGKDAVEHGISG